jgi:hypothetical protein
VAEYLSIFHLDAIPRFLPIADLINFKNNDRYNSLGSILNKVRLR